MTLDNIPGKKVFAQRDVRETPAGTAEANAFTFAAGEGIDVDETDGTITYSGENATATNKGVVELATIAETYTGTDEAKAVTPNSLFETLVPIGAIIAWVKSMTGVPQTLPDCFKACDGSEIVDEDSPMYGENVPDLNGDNRFLRGNSTSGGTGGSSTHDHTIPNIVGNIANTAGIDYGTDFTGVKSTHEHRNIANTGSISTLPLYYDVVWIIRIK